MPLAWSESGTGDYRESPITISAAGECVSPSFVFEDYDTDRHEMKSQLPTVHGEYESLCIIMSCDYAKLRLYFKLCGTALVRSCELVNASKLR